MSFIGRAFLVLLTLAALPGAGWAQRFLPRPPVLPPEPLPVPGPRFTPVPPVVPGHPSAGGEGGQANERGWALWVFAGLVAVWYMVQERQSGESPGLSRPPPRARTPTGHRLPNRAWGIAWLTEWATRKKTIIIRITGTPPGEAPEHVRSAWIGLELPLFPGETGPRTTEQVEVLSMQQTGAMSGYVVDGRKAVELLAARSPDAADWWRQNCAAFLEANGCLIFPPDVCERL